MAYTLIFDCLKRCHFYLMTTFNMYKCPLTSRTYFYVALNS